MTATRGHVVAAGSAANDTPPESYGATVFVVDRGLFAFTRENGRSCTWGYGSWVVTGKVVQRLFTDGGGVTISGALNKPGEHFVFRLVALPRHAETDAGTRRTVARGLPGQALATGQPNTLTEQAQPALPASRRGAARLVNDPFTNGTRRLDAASPQPRPTVRQPLITANVVGVDNADRSSAAEPGTDPRPGMRSRSSHSPAPS